MNAVVKVAETLMSMPQAPCNVRHIFGPGLYIRELSMKAGTIAIGYVQRHAHMNLFVKGAVRILGDDGGYQELHAPMTFTAAPGRKAGVVLEDMVWMNVYATNETDVDKLEEIIFDKSDVDLPRLEHVEDGDYASMLSDVGISAETLKEESEADDVVPFPYGTYKVKVGRSSIDGRGLFATADIESGEVLCPVVVDGKRTPAGRFTNHAKSPNAKIVGDYLIALRFIPGCVGGYDGEEITIDYRLSQRRLK